MRQAPASWNVGESVAMLEDRTRRLQDAINGDMHDCALGPATVERIRLAVRAGVELDAIEDSPPLPHSLRNDIQLLGRIAYSLRSSTNLSAFRDAFSRYYDGSERAVPILELAEADHPLGAVIHAEDDTERFLTLNTFVGGIASDCLREQRTEHNLSEVQIKTLLGPTSQKRDMTSFEVAFRVMTRSFEDAAKRDFTLVSRPYSSRIGAASVGRWNDVLSSGMAPATPQDDVLLAEVVYQPLNRRYAAILPRRPTAPYQIVVGAGMRVADREQIRLEDIAVRVVGERVVLWSMVHQKRIRVVELSMFNSSKFAPYVARLILALASDGIETVDGCKWPGLANMDFIPRLTIGRVVVHVATWRIDFARLVPLTTETLRVLRNSLRLPQYVFVSSNLQDAMFVDLASALAPQLIAELRRGSNGADRVTLSEAVPAKDPLRDLHRPFDEYFASCLVSAPVPKAVPAIPSMRGEYDRPVRMPWMYAQLFGRRTAQRRLLVDFVTPFIQNLNADGMIERWFYVLFREPADHVRLRILPTEGRRTEVVARGETFVEALYASQNISTYAFRPYDPEIERYGGVEAMPFAERLFQASSEVALLAFGAGAPSPEGAAATFLSLCAQLPREVLQWQVATWELAQLKVRWQIDLNTFAAKLQLSNDGTVSLTQLCNIVGARSPAFGRLLRSCFHMHCNRFGLSVSREQEAAALLRLALGSGDRKFRTTST